MKKVYQRFATQEFRAGIAKQQEWKEKNDCGVRALATVCKARYEAVHDLCAIHGRRRHGGTPGVIFQRVAGKLGYRVTDVTEQFRARKIKTYLSLHLYAPKRGRFLVFTRRHVAAYTTGELHDYPWDLNRAKHIWCVLRINKR